MTEERKQEKEEVQWGLKEEETRIEGQSTDTDPGYEAENEAGEINTKGVENSNAKPETTSVQDANNNVAQGVTGTSQAVKRIAVPEPKEQTPTSQLNSGANSEQHSIKGTQATTTSSSPVKALNKSMATNLNKSLKAKQKIISSKEPHPKNSATISEVMNTSPQTSTFPNHLASTIDGESESQPAAMSNIGNLPNSSNTNNINIGESPNPQGSLKGIQKKIAKQNSTRTDFFAAKLASAVDDMESSDSDETFVYENNLNENTRSQHNLATLSTQNDNNSVLDGLGFNSINGLNSPSVQDAHKTEESYPKLKQAAESIYSVQSNKPPHLKNITNSSSNLKPSNVSVENSINSTTAETNTNKENRPASKHTNSSHLITSDNNANEEQIKYNPKLNTSEHSNSSGDSPLEMYQEMGNVPNGLSLSGNRSDENHNSGNSINRQFNSLHDDYNDDRYSFEDVEIDDNIIDDDISTDGDYYSTRRNLGSHNVNSSINGNYPASSSQQNPNISTTNSSVVNVNNSVSNKTNKKNYKSSNSSSKLRSTTSKLFDKKGSQPRRYSIIPDDIDIEDFDDDLIYYDNNVRLPYQYNNGNNFNETSSLINQGHRIPHYRSLNLNVYDNIKNTDDPRAKRHLSTSQAIGNNHHNNNYVNNDIFPFPYPEPYRKSLYDFDEYHDEPKLNRSPDEHNIGVQLGNEPNNKYKGHPHLSSSTGHFLLPRKRSDKLQEHRINCIKSFIYTVLSIIIILSIGFVMGFVLATTRDLNNVSISSIESTIVSQDELIFNIVVEASNPGWLTVTIDEVELDIFAKSGYLDEDPILPSDISTGSVNTVETVLLGTVNHLESELTFTGGFFNKIPISQIGEIKLISPGKNLTNFEDSGSGGNSTGSDNSKKWQTISHHPFDLIVRGVLKYNLPLSKNKKTVVVTNTAYVEPSLS